ncbi:MAG: tyrosine-type recombinase/integrase [Planctomycetota bacterium]
MADLVARYLEQAVRLYCGVNGAPTREVEHLRDAVRPLLELYGGLPASSFGLRQLKTLRKQLIDRGLARKTINDRVNRIIRAFGWAAEEELCRPEVYGALRALQALRRGRSRAKEGKRVLPVAWEHVEATLHHVPRPVAGLIELMWHTRMRPGEACQLRPKDLDTSGKVWFYRPQSHKTQRFDRERIVAIGPHGEEVLRRFLARVPQPSPDGPLFSPCDAVAELQLRRRERRKTPLWPSRREAQARKRRHTPRKQPGVAYTPNSFLGAVRRGCRIAGIPSWTPNRLRHAAATRIRKERGLEAARVVLGHASAAITEVYAEIDQRLAERVMAELG